MHADGIANVDIIHALRRDEDVLLPIARVRRVDLRPSSATHLDWNERAKGTHDHLRRNPPINRIHKHIKLIQTPNRTPNTLPHRQQQTNSRETLLATAQRAGVAFAAAGGSALSGLNVVGLHFEIERVVDVVEDDLSEVAAVGEVVLERDFAPEGDVAPEVEPFLHAGFHGLLQHLQPNRISNNLAFVMEINDVRESTRRARQARP